MEITLQTAKALKVSILLIMFGLFMAKVYDIRIFLSLLAVMLIIRYVEVKKGLSESDKRKN